MKKMYLAGLAASVFLFGGTVHATTTIDFESVSYGTYTMLSFTDLAITYTGGNGKFQVTNASPGYPINGHVLISYFDNPGASPFLVTFNDYTNVTSFFIGVGDYNADVDNDHLQAFDAYWNLLDSDYYQNPASKNGGDYLSVTSNTAIKYVKFWDADPFPGAVYWDNITYNNGNPVPEPATMLLMGTGLAGLAVARRRKANKKD